MLEFPKPKAISGRGIDELAPSMIPKFGLSTWLIVFALGRIGPLAELIGFSIEFLRTRADTLGTVLLALSLLLAREDGGAVR